MNRVTRKMQDFTHRLLLCDPNENIAGKAPGLPGILVCEKLHSHLSTMMGSGGVSGLFSRALALAKVEAPALQNVGFTIEGRLEGTIDIERKEKEGGREQSDAGAILLAHLLTLLVAFIGEKLTLKMVQDALPEWSFNDLDFDNRENNEKAK